MVTLKDQPVILLSGTDQFLKEEHLAKIKSVFLDEQSQDFNFNLFYAGTSGLEEILECAYTAPFLGKKRVVLVHQVEELSAADQELLLSYIKAPRPETVLVLETDETNLAQNFLAEIGKSAQVIFCHPLKDYQLFNWIDSYVWAKGKRIDELAKKLLLNNLGNDLKLLSNSLESLSLYIGEKEKIEFADAEKLTGRDVNATAFELFAAALARDKTKALVILDSLFKDGLNPGQILGALAYKLIEHKSALKPQLKEDGLKLLQKTDSEIKSGSLTPRTALELLLVQLLQLV